MKVLMVHDYGTDTGGAEHQMLRLRAGLRAAGDEVELLTSTASLVPGDVLADRRCFGTTSKLQVLSQVVNPSAVRALRRALREFRPDVVHVRMFLWQLSPAILPLLRRVPAIYHVATYKSICPVGTRLLPDGSRCDAAVGRACLTNGCLTPQSWVPMMAQHALWRRWRPAFDAVVALSHTMKSRLEAHGVRPVDVLYNGVTFREPASQLHAVPTVVYAGRLSREKGVFVLLEALAGVRDAGVQFRAVLAGDGPQRAEVEAAVRRWSLDTQVILTGHQSRESMERAFEGAWVQVIPSLWDEPFGNVATEAMMRGTAVLTSGTGGLAEIVAHGSTGFHLPPGDVGAWQSALTTLLTDPAQCSMLGRAGHERAREHFSEEACLSQVRALHRRVVNARGTAHV